MILSPVCLKNKTLYGSWGRLGTFKIWVNVGRLGTFTFWVNVDLATDWIGSRIGHTFCPRTYGICSLYQPNPLMSHCFLYPLGGQTHKKKFGLINCPRSLIFLWHSLSIGPVYSCTSSSEATKFIHHGTWLFNGITYERFRMILI